jgi:NitT/TauT family transport system ATP-binding protein
MSTLSIEKFVGHVRRLSAPGADPRETHRFLSEAVIPPAALDPYVRFARGRYTRHLVHKCPDVEILVLCWSRGSHAPIHGHEGELCWARVERGRLRFTSYRELSRTPLRLAVVGKPEDGLPGYVDGPADIHAVENPDAFGADAVSLHVYCRPYDECDIYDLATGVVSRARLEYDSIGALEPARPTSEADPWRCPS